MIERAALLSDAIIVNPLPVMPNRLSIVSKRGERVAFTTQLLHRDDDAFWSRE